MNQSASHSSTEQSGAGYETKDVNPYYVGMFGLGLIVMIAIVLVILGWMFRRLETAAQHADPPQSPVADTQTPPPPRLQIEPEADLAQMRRDDQRLLSAYGWTDQQEQSVHIPIERAIDILAQRGFPEPEAPPPEQPQQQATVATEGRSPGERQGQPQRNSQAQRPATELPQAPQPAAQPEERAP